MFFSNISNWSKKLMWAVTILCYCLYIALIIIAPAIVIMCKYNVFGKTEGYRNVTGFGLLVIVVAGIASYIFVKRLLVKLPKISVPEQRFRFGLECVFDCLPIGIALYAMFAVKDDIALAFSTMKICVFLFLAGVIWNNLFIKFLDAEWEIRQGAKFDKEKDKRVKNGVV